MRKFFTLLFCMVLSLSVMAQQKIQMRSADKAECVKSNMTGLNAVFSFSGIEANELQSERGVFSTLSMPNTVIGGNVGDPQIPVVNKLIAVPVGATPVIRVTSYSTTDYNLKDLGIHQLSPRQPDVTKDQKPEFVYNEAAYQKRGLSSEPVARISVNGTMRGVQVGQISIEPVSYDPANNKIRVFNDIEVEVSFTGADAKATEDLLVKTYSPYFDILYKQLFNGRVVRDVYSEHPDLWKSPVRMLVIANRMFENCIQDWVAWKTTKGIYVDLNYTDDIGTSASDIKSFIQTKYAENAPTFLIIMGDKDQVAPSIASASETSCVSDLYYSSVDGDEFVDMFHSRMSAETTAQMTALINKCLEYEQYTMPDPSYLNNVLLIAGEDSGYGVTVGRPTIWYATHYYYNADHGFDNVYEFSQGTYTNCYAPLSSGVGFANYTAHGSKTSWAGPSFDVDDVETLTNEHKYFLAMGNCCQSGDWGYSTTCYGEALTRAENKGAYAYIGSCPNTTWYNDYYFGVGPTTVNTDISAGATGTMPTMEQTGMGCYDAIWTDDAYNTVNSILYVGTLACNAAQALGYTMHSATLYYWQAYHVIGDGSIMPYRVQPTANQVSHMPILPIGMPTYEVSAVPGSYVAISKDGVLHGAGLVGETGTVVVDITPVTSGGDVTICVTAPNRIPYVQTVPAAALEGPYISMDSYTPTAIHVGDNTDLSITFKNVGTAATSGNTNITLSSDNVEIIQGTGSFGPLAAESTTTVSGFSFKIAEGVADGTNVTIHYVAENGEDVYEGNIVVKANEAKLEYAGMTWQGGFTPGETITLTAKFKNTGHYQATNAVVELTTTSDNYLTVNTQPISTGIIEVGQEVSYEFSVTIDANCPETEVIPVIFTMNADGGLIATGNENLKNSCNVVFNLIDSYGDGWNGAALVVSFSDGSESQSLTFSTGSSASYTLEIGNGVHVTLTWSTGSYDSECSFNVQYEGDLMIYQSSSINSGVLYEFDCNCAAASLTYMVTVSSLNTEHGTVSGGGEYSFGESCTVTATPVEGYYFTGWLQDNEVVAGAGATYTFNVTSDVNLVATFAEGLMIGDGGSTTDQYLPSYNYYNYTLTQQIYTAEELGSAGLINSIAFYNGGETKTRTYDVYMVNTTKSEFSGTNDWVTVASDNLVFSGSVEMTANEWTALDFITPFVYDGISNVVLVVDDNTGGYSNSPHMTCLVFSAPNQTLRVYSDGTNYNPFAPSSYSGTLMNVKNQLMLTKSPLDGCVNTTPAGVEVSDITYNTATVNWTGFSESYNVCLGVSNIVTLVDEDFSEDIPADWTNNSNYPWTIVDGYIQSSNSGIASSTSSISITLNFSGNGTIEFDAECMGEGSKGEKTVWDKCIFSIDDATQFTNGENVSGWKHYSYDVSAGEHTLTWSYSKDSSVDPDGDYFAIDNVLIKSNESTWNNPVAVEDAYYTFGHLTPVTDYCVKVQGVCDGVGSAWSETVMFSTTEQTDNVQITELASGINWWTANVGTTLADLEAALGANGIKISDNAGHYVTYNAQYGWSSNPDFVLVPGQMYKIETSVECEIELTGEAINPTAVTITLNNGINWIGFMGSEPIEINDALVNLIPAVGDMITDGAGRYAKYRTYGWGGTLTELVPGEGYVYNSKTEGEVSFTYSVTKTNQGKRYNRDNHWPSPTPGQYANRNHVTYQVNIDDVLQASNDIEVAAFIGDEVRGVVRLIEPYPGPLSGQYYTYLTVFGNPADVGQMFTFKTYDHATGIEYDYCTLSLEFSGEEEYEYGGIEEGYYIDFYTSYRLSIGAYTETGGWYLITSPLASDADAENVDNMTDGTFDLYRFNQEATLEWENWKSSDNYHFNLEAGRGYLYANSADVELVFKGPQYNGDGVVTIHNYSGHPASGWNLVGNPFTVGASVSRDFYEMNAEDGRDEIILSERTSVEPLEGIFVYAEETNETVAFAAESTKSVDVRERVVVNLSRDEENVVIDRVIVRMGENGTLPKYMLNSEHANVSVPQNGKEYAVVSVADTDMVPVNFKADAEGTYTLRVNAYDVEMEYMHLIDNITGEDVDMLLEDSYTFLGSPSDMRGRFTLRFSKGQDGVEEVFAYQNGSDIVVSGEGTLEVYDVMGRFVGSYAINGVETIQSLPMGVYIFRMIGETNMTQKIVIR